MSQPYAFVVCLECHKIIALSGEWTADLTIAAHVCRNAKVPERLVRYYYPAYRSEEKPNVIYVWPPSRNSIPMGDESPEKSLRDKLRGEGVIGPCTMA